MKKTTVSLILAGILAVSAAGTVSAAKSKVQEVDYTMMYDADYYGDWFYLDGVDTYIFIPSDWELDEESADPDNGIYYVWYDSYGYYAANISYASAKELGGKSSPEKLVKNLSKDSSFSNVSRLVTNGYDVVAYDVEENDCSGFSWFGSEGGEYAFTVYGTFTDDTGLCSDIYVNALYSFGAEE